MKLAAAWEMLVETFQQWLADKVPQLGAALAYYAVFSMAPLVLIAIAIASRIFGEQAARGEIVHQIESIIGRPAAQALQDMLKHTHASGDSRLATLVGVGILFFAASGVFVQLQESLNIIWKVRPKSGRGIWGIVRDRFFSFAVVTGTGFLLLVFLIINAALSWIEEHLAPNALTSDTRVWQAVSNLIALVFITLLFALMYRILPDAHIGWRYVWIGAPITAVLFTAGKYLIGLYLGWSSTTSAFGAAGSLVVILVWVYYSSQVLLFGAEFTRVLAQRNGAEIIPKRNAERIPV
jgi:membrane protein